MRRISLLFISLLALSSSAKAEAPPIAQMYVEPFNTIIVAQWGINSDQNSSAQTSGEFKAIVFRQSKRLCYEIDLTKVPYAPTVQIGRGILGHGRVPVFELSALPGSKSGTCTKLPKNVAVDLLDHPLLMFLHIQSTPSENSNTTVQFRRTTQNVVMDNLKAVFANQTTGLSVFETRRPDS